MQIHRKRIPTDFERMSYILVTPARNESEHIDEVIRSVIKQSCLPEVWVIVSDGSTDGTDEIVQKYLPDHSWIKLIRRPEHIDRNWASKAHCFNTGYEEIKSRSYNIIGNLDADITLDDPDYFSFLLSKFSEHPNLGVAGTPFVENNSHYDYRFTNIAHVSGACQLFRRECFEQIGGYTPIKGGGIDWVAVTTARMNGWETRTFTDKVCYHHRPMGSGNYNKLAISFKQGQKDYFLGGHPLWQVFRAVHQSTRKPYIIGGLSILLGYVWSFIRQIDRPISPDLMTFHRKEQMQRLQRFLFRSHRA